MNSVVLELSDAALADLHAAQLLPRRKWRGSPGLESHEVTASDAVRTVLAVLVGQTTR